MLFIYFFFSVFIPECTIKMMLEKINCSEFVGLYLTLLSLLSFFGKAHVVPTLISKIIPHFSTNFRSCRKNIAVGSTHTLVLTSAA